MTQINAQKSLHKQTNNTPTHKLDEDIQSAHIDPATPIITPSQVLGLQRVVGNQAVISMLSKSASGEEELQKVARKPFTSGMFKMATGEEELQKSAGTSKGDEEGSHTSGCGCALCKGSGKIMRHAEIPASTQKNSTQHDNDIETDVVEHESDTITQSQLSDLSKASVSVSAGAPASLGLGGNYGLTYPESVDAVISAKKVGGNWQPVVKKLTGHYSLQASLLAGQSEITGPGGNTTSANWKEQVKNLNMIGEDVGNPWYMLEAVVKHEKVHAKRFKPGLRNARTAITNDLKAVTIPDAVGKTKAQAIIDLKASGAYQAALVTAKATWLTEILTLVANDHTAGGPTEKAERKIVDPMRKRICKHAKKQKWGTSPHC